MQVQVVAELSTVGNAIHGATHFDKARRAVRKPVHVVGLSHPCRKWLLVHHLILDSVFAGSRRCEHKVSGAGGGGTSEGEGEATIGPARPE